MLASLLSTFCILSFPLSFSSSFLLLLFSFSSSFFLYSSCPPFTHTHWPGCSGRVLVSQPFCPPREPSRLWLPSTLLRAVPEVGRGPPLSLSFSVSLSIRGKPSPSSRHPSFSSYVSLLCNEPAKICLEIPYTWRDPSLHEISDGESRATFP